jgi:hypothetical protein
MADITPAQLSLELNVDQKRIRDVLRDLYETLPEGVTRWILDDDQADAVRVRLKDRTPTASPVWTLEPGDIVRRRELHEAYGGTLQSGIVTLRILPDILVFTSVESGFLYGYHVFEGFREDGSFAYTGQGQRGNQEFKRGNLALRDSGPRGRRIRLFAVNGTAVTYVGEFTTGNPTCWIETIPDVDGNPRNGIIFNLVPVDADSTLLAPPNASAQPVAQVAPWTPPDSSDIAVVNEVPTLPGDRVVSRIEFALQADFGEWLSAQGDTPKRLRLTSAGATIEPDLFIESRGWIVEAKKSSGREYVRAAIGQVLDYVHVAEQAGITAIPLILLPGRPTPDLVALLHRHDITLVVRAGEGFDVTHATAATTTA